MQQSERLKICATCKNKTIDKEHQTICKLTKLPPDFEDSCPTYAYKEVETYDSGSGGIGWRTILSIGLICLGLVRIAVRCNKNQSRDRSGYHYEDSYDYGSSRQEVERALAEVGAESNSNSRQITEREARAFGLLPVKRDSVVKLSKNLSYLIPTGSFTKQENVSEVLPVYYIEPQQYMVLVMRITTSDSVLSEWKFLRSILAKDDVKNELKIAEIPGQDEFSYQILSVKDKVTGYGKIYTEGKDAYVLTCEHNGKTASQIEDHLKIIAGSSVIRKKK